jgi:hypothetical protein
VSLPGDASSLLDVKCRNAVIATVLAGTPNSKLSSENRSVSQLEDQERPEASVGESAAVMAMMLFIKEVRDEESQRAKVWREEVKQPGEQ